LATKRKRLLLFGEDMPAHGPVAITLNDARTIVEGALEHARSQQYLPMTVAVLDTAAELVAFAREDGSSTRVNRLGRGLVEQKVGDTLVEAHADRYLARLAGVVAILRGRYVAEGAWAVCTPGSSAARLAAEAEGIDRIFTDAGVERSESGCGFCSSGGGGYADRVRPGSRVISSTNRNFGGRQGPGVRTHLASDPVTVPSRAALGRGPPPGNPADIAAGVEFVDPVEQP
jgi:aconitase B